MINNLEILVWVPVSVLVFAMLVWALVIKVSNKNITLKTFNTKYSTLGWGWLVMSSATFVYLVFKSLTTPMLRPILEAAPRDQRPTVEEVVEQPSNLVDLTLQAKPKNVVNNQPETPLVNEALKHVQEK